jgi:hypothetical protein
MLYVTVIVIDEKMRPRCRQLFSGRERRQKCSLFWGVNEVNKTRFSAKLVVNRMFSTKLVVNRMFSTKS